MPLVASAYKDTITYWGNPRPDGVGGWTFDAPVQFEGRWEEKNENFTNQQGEIEVSNAIVYTPQSVEVGGYLLFGTSAASDPLTVSGAYRIRQKMDIPSLRTSAREIRAFL